MSSHLESWTIGIEEEYQIIDPVTRALAPDSQQIFSLIEPGEQKSIEAELQTSQIESATPICLTLSEARSAVMHQREVLITAAARANRWIAASGTHPFSHWHDQEITHTERYAIMEQRYRQLAREQVILGCHIHIGCPDRELAIQIMNRARLWLAPLLALSANSPFWLGDDTGYASYRTPIWCRWPMAGPPPHLASSTEYDQLVRMLIQTNTIADASHIYWDIRLSDRYPTIEFRVMDVCLSIDETVMLAGLIRALAQTCAEQALKKIPYIQAPNELLRAAHWRAARYGLNSTLVDPDARNSLPAHELIERLLLLLHPVLKERGEWDEISTQVQLLLRNGNGATRQREIFQRTEQHEAVVDFVVTETARGLNIPISTGSYNKISS
ncbi:carboxylate-amine ligase [Dictyobacter arantiisoli]|uniref:Putative glutamate--cysteine ligase 2 n=1 Tax=Dictyobacter arantiisoli TaxID=2014874 RepID=A0A5A5TB68_9CHLR|nr:carboxylate-amine ligase [Dictyobacter arantiisoli]GCF08740.1 putative glutamate--cysteine ligase 2 [Dictyobacter arantiisoli]